MEVSRSLSFEVGTCHILFSSQVHSAPLNAMDHFKVNPPALVLPDVPDLHDDRFVYDGLGLARIPEAPGEIYEWERLNFL